LEEDLERLYLRGPAAVERQLLDKRVACRDALALATKAAERDQLNKMIAVMNRGLRALRKKKCPPPMYYDLDALTDRERVMARLAKKGHWSRKGRYLSRYSPLGRRPPCREAGAPI
jgi:hypothetical protein